MKTEEYLAEHKITTDKLLKKHLEELKRNTFVDVELIDSLLNFFAKKSSPSRTINSMFLDEIVFLENSVLNKGMSTRHKANQEKKVIEDWNREACNTATAKVSTSTDDLVRLEILRDQLLSEDFKVNSLKGIANLISPKDGKKDSQTVEKAPVFTYCKVNKNALEALSLRALYGHNRYETGDDWENFSRVPNGDFEYSNSQFRHALEIGEETEEAHLIASAWNSVARLEIYLRNKVK